MLVKLGFQIKFYSIVTSSNRFNVPFDVLVLLNALDIVYVYHRKQVNKNSYCADDEPPEQSLMIQVVGDHAGRLEEEHRVVTTDILGQ